MLSSVSIRQAVACALFCALPLSVPVNAAPPPHAAGVPARPDVQSDRLIIRFKDHVSFRKANTILEQLSRQQGGKPEFVRETVNNGMVFKFKKTKSRREWARVQRWLRSTRTVDYVEVDTLLQPVTVAPDDAYFQYQWPLTEATGGINILNTWEQGISGADTVVAVIDTGYRPHVDLAPNLITGYDMIGDSFVANDGDGRDGEAADPGDYVLAGECGSTQDINSSWHGTHVAGTVAAAANNQTGIAGVAYDAKVQPVRALGKCGGYLSDIADAVLWASGHSVFGVPANPTPAQVLNLSLGGGGSCSQTMQQAIDAAVANNSVVVVAAGNNNADAGQFTPANCQNVITVAATNREGGKAYYSNTGSVVDLAAPGGSMLNTGSDGVLSTLNTGATDPEMDTYAFYQGTSMAAPHVAGAAALIMSANPDLTPAEVEAILKNNARPFPASCSGCGTGIIDVSAAVSVALSLAGGDEPEEPVNAAPSANFVATVDGLSVQFTDSSADSDGSISAWQWNLGDGSSSTARSPVHSYNAAGTYTVTLTVTDDQGATDTVSQAVEVTEPVNVAPSANFVATVDGLSVQFTDSSVDSDGSISAWQWNLGDGSSSTARNPAHSYNAEGTYTVTLTVTDDQGATDTVSQAVEVTAETVEAMTLKANLYKVRGRHKADLYWQGATTSHVDIYRNGVKQFTTANDGAVTDHINRRGKGRYVYQVCEAGTETCSDLVRVRF